MVRDEIVDGLQKLIISLAPDANLRSMYGGIVIELETDNPKSRVGGYYAYANHESLELAQGAELSDPDGVLEGSGQFRRHVKLRRVEDIAVKNCRGFLEQAIDRAS